MAYVPQVARRALFAGTQAIAPAPLCRTWACTSCRLACFWVSAVHAQGESGAHVGDVCTGTWGQGAHEGVARACTVVGRTQGGHVCMWVRMQGSHMHAQGRIAWGGSHAWGHACIALWVCTHRRVLSHAFGTAEKLSHHWPSALTSDRQIHKPLWFGSVWTFHWFQGSF